MEKGDHPIWRSLHNVQGKNVHRDTHIGPSVRKFKILCDTDHYLVIAKLRERLSVCKQAAQKFEGERFNLRKLKELEVKENYHIEITNRFAALENLNVDVDVNRVRENIKENIKTSDKESLGLHKWKQHKPWFDKVCVDFLNQRKQAKMQWIQDSSRSNVDNLNNIRGDVSRHFTNKKKAYFKVKIEELETNSKINKSGTCIGALMTSRRDTILELLQ